MADLAASDSSTGTLTCSALPGWAEAATEFARRLITGTPRATRDDTVTAPPKMDWLARASASISTASARKPESSLNAVRAAISLFSGLEATRIAAGLACSAILASSSACGATR